MAYRFSVLPYANALPLVHCLTEASPTVALSYYPPRHSVVALLNGRADAALIPVIDFFAHPELMMIPGLGIGADGDVTSVLLRCHRPLRTVTTITLDPESKTSNVLAQIMVREHFQLPGPVEFRRGSAGAEADICIGDRALRTAPALEAYDLAGEWKKMTGLPFVFAVWAVNRLCPQVEELTQLLQTAKERGCRSRRRLAQLCSRRLGLAEDRCYDYLVNRLHYDLGPRELKGMDLFRTLVADFLKPAPGREVRTVPSRTEMPAMPTMERS